MKKTYIIPTTESIILESTAIIAESSTTYDPSKTIEGNNDIGVKGNSQSYDVWSDDWSK